MTALSDAAIMISMTERQMPLPSPPPAPVRPKVPFRKRRWWPALIVGVVSFFLWFSVGAATGTTKTVTAPTPAPVTVSAAALPAVTETVAGPTVTETVAGPMVDVPGPRVTVRATRTVSIPGPVVTRVVEVTAPAAGGGGGGGSGLGTLLEASGSGIKNTAEFTTTAASFTVRYSFDCSAYGSSGNFIAELYQGNSSVDSIANQLAKSGSDSTPLYDGAGTYHISVNSECDWTVKVIS